MEVVLVVVVAMVIASVNLICQYMSKEKKPKKGRIAY